MALESLYLTSTTTTSTSKNEIEIETEEEDLNAGAERIVCLVEGPKRVGKSTFARQLLNRLLTRLVFFLCRGLELTWFFDWHFLLW